jgi:hypothetical protein
MTYCVYLTSYKGNKLPPFYIGYSSMDKLQSGYKGSVQSKRYKQAWIEETTNHPELFSTKILSTHDSRKDANTRELKLLRSLKAISNPLYANRACFPQFDNTGRTRPDIVANNIAKYKGKSYVERFGAKKAQQIKRKQGVSQTKAKARIWEVDTPTGEIEIVENLKLFCKRRGVVGYENLCKGSCKGGWKAKRLT